MLVAFTDISNGLPTLVRYVCVGADANELTTVLAVPSPHDISHLLGLPYVETGVTGIVIVTGLPIPEAVGLAVNAGVLTYVLFLTFSIASFKSSIASVTLVFSSQVLIVPGVTKSPGLVSTASVGNPNGIALPTLPLILPALTFPVIVISPDITTLPWAVMLPTLTLP